MRHFTQLLMILGIAAFLLSTPARGQSILRSERDDLGFTSLSSKPEPVLDNRPLEEIVNSSVQPLDLQQQPVLPIPEPATYMLFGLGLLTCVQRFRRSKNK
jgi:hypothetical protein